MRRHSGLWQEIAERQRAGQGSEERADDAPVEAIGHEHGQMPDRNADHGPNEDAHAARPFSTSAAWTTSTGCRERAATAALTLPRSAALSEDLPRVRTPTTAASRAALAAWASA